MTVKLLIAQILNAGTRGLAVTAITGYQRFISPRKGFSCAHRVLYGCDSCSQYFKSVIAEEGIFTAIANAKGRFRECREANEILKMRRAERKARCQTNCRANSPTNSRARGQYFESIGDLGNEDIPEGLETPQEPSDPQIPQPLGGAQWENKKRSQAADGNNSSNSCNSDDCLDCGDCADGIGVLDCNNLSCPDLSCPDLNCGDADCLSGMDCSGCDLGGADCSGCGDCGSCG